MPAALAKSLLSRAGSWTPGIVEMGKRAAAWWDGDGDVGADSGAVGVGRGDALRELIRLPTDGRDVTRWRRATVEMEPEVSSTTVELQDMVTRRTKDLI